MILSDKKIMAIKEYFPVIFGVLKDFRVIGTVIVMLLVIEFTKFVTTYKKKPRKKKDKKAPKPAPAPKKEEAKEENAEASKEEKK